MTKELISMAEYLGMLAVMAFMWVIVPWDPDLTRFDIFMAFVTVALIGFGAVVTVEMIYEEIRRLIRRRKRRR